MNLIRSEFNVIHSIRYTQIDYIELDRDKFVLYLMNLKKTWELGIRGTRR